MFKKKIRRAGTARKRPRVNVETDNSEEERDFLKKHDESSLNETSITKRRKVDDDTIDNEQQRNNKRSATTVKENDQDAAAKSTTSPKALNKSSTKKINSFGPQAQPRHHTIRTSISIDYQPDVCKDYKETGFCGFGDACKFLHDRTNYKAGWQLDRDWQSEQERKRKLLLNGIDPEEVDGTKGEGGNGVEKDEDGLPFACWICRKEFKKPVVTVCGHYFCESCILKRMEKEQNCPVCRTGLGGILNVAHKIIAKRKAREVKSKVR